jgi:hypothetical protein
MISKQKKNMVAPQRAINKGVEDFMSLVMAELSKKVVFLHYTP